MTSEALIQHSILKAYGAHPRFRLWRANTGRAQMGGRWVRFNIPGTPDILGVYNMGPIFGDVAVALGIEVKSDKGKQNPDQLTFQRMYDRMGALYILARSVEDVANAVTQFTQNAEARLAAKATL